MAHQDRIDQFIEELQRASPRYHIAPFGVWGRITLIQERHLSIVSNALRPLSLTFNEYQIIVILLLSGPPYELNPTTLIQRKVMSSGGIANLLNKMEAADLIMRTPSRQDRRGVLVRLTDNGILMAKKSLAAAGHIEQDLLSGMTEDEIEILCMLLRKTLYLVELSRTGHDAESNSAVAEPATGPETE
jgi:DNA-binding MarR family transcriptional regulator